MISPSSAVRHSMTETSPMSFPATIRDVVIPAFASRSCIDLTTGTTASADEPTRPSQASAWPSQMGWGTSPLWSCLSSFPSLPSCTTIRLVCGDPCQVDRRVASHVVAVFFTPLGQYMRQPSPRSRLQISSTHFLGHHCYLWPTTRLGCPRSWHAKSITRAMLEALMLQSRPLRAFRAER